MAKEEWGAKRACPSCGVRFYDLAADPATCPACEATFTQASLVERRPAVAETKAKPKKAAPAAPVVEDSDDLVVVADDEDEDDDLAIADDVLIDDDDDDDDDLGEIGDVAAKKDDDA